MKGNVKLLTKKPTPETEHICISINEAKYIAHRIYNNEKWNGVGFDYEANGLDTLSAQPLLLAVGNPDDQLVIDTTSYTLHEVLPNGWEEKLHIGHSIKYDYSLTKQTFGYELRKMYDTMLAEQIIYRGCLLAAPKRLQGIKAGLAPTTLRRVGYIPKHMNKDTRMEFVGVKARDYTPRLHQVQYAAGDIQYLHQIRESQLRNINKLGISWYIDEICMPLIRVLGNCELTGFDFDVEKWKNNIRESERKAYSVACKLDELMRKIRDDGGSNSTAYITGGKYDRTRLKPIRPQPDMFGKEVEFDFIVAMNRGNINWSSPNEIIEVCAGLQMPLPAETIGHSTPSFSQRKKKSKNGGEPVREIETTFKFLTGKNEIREFLKLDVTAYPQFYSMLIEYREAVHSISSFGTNFLKKINPVTGRVHTIYRQERADTGRLQSGGGNKQKDKYNSQNIPRDKKYRHCFLAPPGYSMTTCDLGGAEVVLMCDKAYDKLLYQLAVIKDDVHSPIATKCWRNIYLYKAGEGKYWKSPKEFMKIRQNDSIHYELKNQSIGLIQEHYEKSLNFVINKQNNKPMRTQFKPVTFGVVYGAHAATVARVLGITKEEAQIVIWILEESFPDTFAYVKKVAADAITDGYVTIDNRTNLRVFFPDIIKAHKAGERVDWKDAKDAESGARNYTIQGAQASMVKEAMVEIDRAITSQGLPCKLHGQVHDELIYSQPLYLDGKSDEWNNTKNSYVKFRFDNIEDAKSYIDSIKPNRGINRYYDEYNPNAVLQALGVNVSFPEFVSLTMTQVANRYLNHFKMGADYEVLPYWTK